MEVGLVGKTNVGKSSFFKSATTIDVEISNRTFCTIKPNVGLTYVTSECPCKESGSQCSPKNSKCINGTRLIPVKLWDIAGLIPGAHEGKGLGNQFLNDIIQADMLIHVVDASGTTDSEGNSTRGHDPSKDILFLEKEIDLWFADIIKRNLVKIKDESKAEEIMSGLGIKGAHVRNVFDKFGIEDIERFAMELRKISKPMVIAANKIDLPSSEDNLKRMKNEFPHLTIVPCSAEAENALRTADSSGFIEYVPGSSDFKVSKDLNEKQDKALDLIRENILSKYGSTGVQECLNRAVFDFMKYIVVYPVVNEKKFSDKKGNVLPDAFLMPPGSTALDLAFKIHTDIGSSFIGAIDARTARKVGSDHILKNNDIIKILSK